MKVEAQALDLLREEHPRLKGWLDQFEPAGSPKHIVVIGIDGTEQALSAIRKGQMDATLSQNPLTMAAQSVSYIEQYLHGDKSGIPAHRFWPHVLLTRANLDSSEVKAYGLWGDEVTKGQ